MILETADLCKSFKNQIAVNNISLHIKRNSVYGLLGPNGACENLKARTLALCLPAFRIDEVRSRGSGYPSVPPSGYEA